MEVYGRARKIVVYELLSLDGVAEDPDGFFADWDDAMDANLAAVIATQDAVILGRRSYTEWAQFWPSSQVQPFATFINGVTKYVATSTPLDRDWANATALDGGLVEFVRISSSSAEAMSASTQVSRSHRRCSPPTLSTNSSQARDSAEDRRPRATTPRRLAIDSARIDPMRDLTDWLSARRLSRYSLGRVPGSNRAG